MAHADAGWSFHWMEFLDNTYLRQRHLERYKLDREDSFPSEYMRRHFWFTIQQDRATVKHRDLIGPEHLLWSSHFPLDATNWPDDRQQAMRVTEELPADDQGGHPGRPTPPACTGFPASRRASARLRSKSVERSYTSRGRMECQ